MVSNEININNLIEFEWNIARYNEFFDNRLSKRIEILNYGVHHLKRVLDNINEANIEDKILSELQALEQQKKKLTKDLCKRLLVFEVEIKN